MPARLALTSLLVIATPATAAIAPVEGRTYRLVTSTERDDGTAIRRFSMARDIVFTREPAGLLATVTIRAGSGDKNDSSDFYSRALSALAGQALRYHLDPDGRVIAIDDLDTAWERLAAAVDAMAPAATPESKSARRMGDILRALPPAKRQAMLASIVAPLSLPRPQIGTRAIALSAEAIAGHKADLTGRETVSRLPSGLLRVERTAQDAPSSPMIALNAIRTFDPASGLLLTAEERRTLRIAEDTGRRLIITDRVTLTPVVS